MKGQRAYLSDQSAVESRSRYGNGGHPHPNPCPSCKERGFESHTRNDVCRDEMDQVGCPAPRLPGR